jgi:hypothetical protein
VLAVRLGGTWLRAIGPFAEVSMTHAWPHGFEQTTWRMPKTLRHELLERGGAKVEVFQDGIRRGIGKLAEPAADGQYVATGIWSQASGVWAVDGSGNATNVPDTAIDAAIARGALTWTRPASITAGLGKRWYVDADGAVRASADPTTPSYVVPQVAAGRGLTLAEDDYYSHLVGTYLAAGPVYATVTYPPGPTEASVRWGYREASVDLTDMGVITSGTATTQLQARLALTGARLSFAEALQVGYGQITTPGGTPVPLATPQAGEMVRLMGVTDNSRPAGTAPYTDIVLGRTAYSDGAPTATLTPVNLAARSLEEVLVRGAAA